MIELRYHLDPAYNKPHLDRDLSGANDTDLLYRLFCSDVYFEVDGRSFDARWGWIPILHFAGQLPTVIDQLRSSGKSHIEFTEAESLIEFQLTAEGRVNIAATYGDEAAQVALEELEAAFRAFNAQVFREIEAKWPSLARNEQFARRREEGV